jgi:hypothetical protein
MEPRKPTEDEKKELLGYLVEHDNYAIEDIETIVDCAYMAVFDDYTTGGPGYFGKVMVVVYDGYPSQTETYIWHNGEHGSQLTRVDLEAA